MRGHGELVCRSVGGEGQVMVRKVTFKLGRKARFAEEQLMHMGYRDLWGPSPYLPICMYYCPSHMRASFPPPLILILNSNKKVNCSEMPPVNFPGQI